MKSARSVSTRSEIESEVIAIRSDHVIRTKRRRRTKIRRRIRTKIRIRRRKKRRRAPGVRDVQGPVTNQVVGNPSPVKRIAVNEAANRAAAPQHRDHPVAVTKRSHIARTRRRRNNSYLDTIWKTNRAFLELATHTHKHTFNNYTTHTLKLHFQ